MAYEPTILNENWREALHNLRTEYSDAQIAILLGLSHSAVTGRLDTFVYTSYEDKILDITKKLRTNSSQRVLFIEWCNRVVKNDYALSYRAIRQYLKLSNKKLEFLKGKRELSSYENGTNIMPKHIYTEFLEYLQNKGIVYDKRYVINYKKFIKKQINEFITKKLYLRCPSLISILPHINTTDGIGKEYQVYEEIKKTFPNTFLGCTFAKDLRRKKDIDILTLDGEEVIAIEVKDFRKYKTTLRRRLRELNASLRMLRKDYKEVTKTIAIVPSINISKEIKSQFEKNNNLLLDKKDFQLFLNRKLIKKEKSLGEEEVNNVRAWLTKFNISSYMLQLLFQMHNLNIYVANILKKRYNFSKVINHLKFIESVLEKYNKRQLHFLINKYASLNDKEIIFLRNFRRIAGESLSDLCSTMFNDRNKNKNKLARLESGKIRLKWLRKRYKDHLTSHVTHKDLIIKTKKAVIEDQRRWETAEEFPMVVGLKYNNHNELENYVAKTLRKRGYKIAKNALFNNKDLTKMTLNFQHPEADIITKKGDSYTLISCKQALKKPKNSQFYVSLKAEIDKLSEYVDDVDFSKAILVVKADLVPQTWKTLNDYVRDKNITIWKIDDDAY